MDGWEFSNDIYFPEGGGGTRNFPAPWLRYCSSCTSYTLCQKKMSLLLRFVSLKSFFRAVPTPQSQSFHIIFLLSRVDSQNCP